MEKHNLVINSAIELGQNEGQGKGRYFKSRFIESGVAHYEEFGDILITKETLDKFINTMVGCPVIINHKDVTDKNVDKLRVGVISRVWFEPIDNWYYCEGVLTDAQAIDLIKNQGWSVSCSYDFVSDNMKKTYHGKDIDMEFIDGNFLHLAIVENPRYEGANIVVNSKKQKENVENDKWITVKPNGEDGKGKHLKLEKGETPKEAMKRQWGVDIEKKNKTSEELRQDFRKYQDEIFKKHENGTLTEDERLEYIEKSKEFNKEYVDKKVKEQNKEYANKKAKEKNVKPIEPTSPTPNYPNHNNPQQEPKKQDKEKQGESEFERILRETKKKKSSINKVIEIKDYIKTQTDVDVSKYIDEQAMKWWSKGNDFIIDWSSLSKQEQRKIEELQQTKHSKFDLELSGTWAMHIKPKKQINNSTNEKENIPMAVLDELKSFILSVVNNEEDKKEEKETVETEKEVENEDEEKEEEKEEKAENKCKNEEIEVEIEKDDEDEDEDEEEVKEEAKNKCKNSMDKLKDMAMGGNIERKVIKTYTSQKERLELGNKF